MNADEEYVRSKWENVTSNSTPQYGVEGNLVYWNIYSDDWLIASGHETEDASWSAAAEFTCSREEEIRQVEEEIGVCEGCLRMWQPPFGNDYGGVGPMKRILSREQAVLDKLKRGMK